MTTAPSADATIRRSAFLDSSVLVSLFEFWDVCQQAQVPPDQFAGMGSLEAMDALRDALRSKGADIDALEATDGEYVKRGMVAFNSLRDAAGDYLYISSRVCWAEAHHALLEALGLERLVRAKVPYGLRRKRPQVLYRTFLQEADHNRLNHELDAFREALRLDHDLDVTNVEDPAVGQEVAPGVIWDGAASVWSHVLMEVFDAYVCSASILAKADVYVSADPHLRRAFNRLRDPDDDWKVTADSLREVFGVASNTDFPQPLHPGGTLP